MSPPLTNGQARVERLGGWGAAAAIGIAAAVAAMSLVRAGIFDDSWMFYRYALHVREGLGVAWNPDGIPTYGLTSLLWLFVVLPFTFLPLDAMDLLRVASCATGVLALIIMAQTVMRHASSIMAQPVIALASVAVPLLVVPDFVMNLGSGMDTMLSLAANAALVSVVLRYLRTPSQASALAVGVLAYVSVLARPDNGICALGVPFLAWLVLSKDRNWQHLAGLVGLPSILIAAELAFCDWYFGVPVPLGFYAKSARSYVGFVSRERALDYLADGAAYALPFVAALCGTVRRPELPRLAVFLLPPAATFLYLLTVRQIMGFGGRYYVPFLPFLIVPALLCVDGFPGGFRRLWLRLSLALLLLVVLYKVSEPLVAELSAARLRGLEAQAVPVPRPPITAREPLPAIANHVEIVAEQIAGRLPPGASIAASEVGRLGAQAIDNPVIDLVGLNDTAIGRRGVDMDALMQRLLDVIFFPHTDYTGLRQELLSDRRLQQRYMFIRWAFVYGLAIRRDSAFRPEIEALVRAAWEKRYPGYRLDDYVARW